MKIAIIGTGYIGLVQGVIMSDLGFDITCIDNNEEKIEILKKGKSPIYEPGLEEVLKKSIKNGKIKFTSNYNFGIKNADVIFLAVGTPPLADGSSNLNYITAASKNLAQFLSKDSLIITKSTVPMGTNKKIKKIILDELKKRNMGNLNVSVISNPEFLREGKAVYDFLNPDRIVVGIDENDNKEKIKKEIYKIYEYFLKKQIPIIFTNLETAELSKYSSNAFLSVKISFINEMAMLSEKIGANIEDVSKIMGFDHRIGNEFLNAGLGFGGSCFPKDALSILNIGKNNDCEMSIVDSAIKFNNDLKDILTKKIKNKMGNVKGKIISVLGLSFKPGTDDIREAPAIKIIKKLINLGAKIKVYCPQGMEKTKKELKNYSDYIKYCENEYECAKDSNCLILTTEWKQFENMDLIKIKNIMKNNYFFDFRNMFSKNKNIRNYFHYYPIGRN